ncbi:MAG: tRNA pseudouridine(55) synthase TruB [Nevskiales bacterium]|nr:tRNA pseudouridine(55) synthase TruB [Nevskiales bacterium]
MLRRGNPGRPVSGILLLDKPPVLSSNAALQQVKRLYRADKAGHTGSLDPLATGLLPICLGQGTKLCGYLLESDKHYRVRAKLGERTDTADAEGKVVTRSDPTRLTRAELSSVLPRFTGTIQQRPPMFSALKYQGRRLYQLARVGQDVVRPERTLHIHELQLTDFEPGSSFELDVRCSKGTYVRTLVEDIASAVGQCAHVIALRRLESTPFYRPRMHSLNELEKAAEQGLAVLDALLLPLLAALTGWSQVKVNARHAFNLARGQAVQIADMAPSGRLAVLDEAGTLLGIGEAGAGGRLVPKRWLARISHESRR